MFIATIDEKDARGAIAEIYQAEAAALGFVMEGTKCWTALPHIAPMIEHLLHEARNYFSLGLVNWRLITLIAAKSRRATARMSMPSCWSTISAPVTRCSPSSTISAMPG